MGDSLGAFAAQGPSGAFSSHGLLKLVPFATICWPEGGGWGGNQPPIHKRRVPSAKRGTRAYTEKYPPAYSFSLDGAAPPPPLREQRPCQSNTRGRGGGGGRDALQGGGVYPPPLQGAQPMPSH